MGEGEEKGTRESERMEGEEEAEEEEEGGGFGRGAAARPCGDGTRVRPDWLGPLMEVDLGSPLPLTDSDCSVNTFPCSVPEATVSRRRPHTHARMRVYRCALHILTHTSCTCALKPLQLALHQL